MPPSFGTSSSIFDIFSIYKDYIGHKIVPVQSFDIVVEKDLLDHNVNEDESETVKNKEFCGFKIRPFHFF